MGQFVVGPNGDRVPIGHMECVSPLLAELLSPTGGKALVPPGSDPSGSSWGTSRARVARA
eukprot:13884267-Alexandrium_andersonii.AAC.1